PDPPPSGGNPRTGLGRSGSRPASSPALLPHPLQPRGRQQRGGAAPSVAAGWRVSPRAGHRAWRHAVHGRDARRGGADAGRIPRPAPDAPVTEFSSAGPGQQGGPPLDAAVRRPADAGDQAVVTAAASLSEADPGGFRSLEALGDIDDDALPLIER